MPTHKNHLGRKDFLPVEPAERSLLPLSSRRTQVRLKPLLSLPGLRQIHSEPTVGLRRKSAVCGLNGHRLYYIISLFKVTYKSIIQVSRTFHALFTKTLENSDRRSDDNFAGGDTITLPEPAC